MEMLNGYIMVEPIEKEQQEGFQLVEAVEQHITIGKVIEPKDFPADATVIFSKYDGYEQDIDGKKVKFIKSEDLIAVK